MLMYKGKYGDAIVYADSIDDASVSQIYDIINSPQVKGETVRIMPDCHCGSGCIIGYSQTYTEGGPIDPDIVGCDLSCGILAVKYSLLKPLSEESLLLLDSRIRKVIPMGMKINERWDKSREKEFKKFLKTKLERYRSMWPEMVRYDGLGNIEQFITQFCRRIGIDESVWWKSLGSMGSSNHFIEISQNPEDLEHIWLLIHTGSRNLGIKVWKYWKTMARKGRVDKEAIKSAEREIKKKYAGEGWAIREKIEALHKSGKHTIPPSRFLTYPSDLEGYLSDSFVLGAWAEYNRFLISQRIFEQARTLGFGKEVERVESVHNYIDPSDRVIRKGAIKAYEGKKLVIPISMAFGSIIGEGKSNPDWNYTAPHGAGRKMSRGEAKKNISMEAFKESMKGITSTSVVPECLDESPLAYKDPSDILGNIKDTVEIKEILKPILSIKDKSGLL